MSYKIISSTEAFNNNLCNQSNHIYSVFPNGKDSYGLYVNNDIYHTVRTKSEYEGEYVLYKGVFTMLDKREYQIKNRIAGIRIFYNETEEIVCWENEAEFRAKLNFLNKTYSIDFTYGYIIGTDTYSHPNSMKGTFSENMREGYTLWIKN